MHEPQHSLFQLTVLAIQNVEAKLLGYSSKGSTSDWIARHISFPFKYLMRGAEELYRPALKFSILYILLLLAGQYAISKLTAQTNVPTELLRYIWLALGYVSLFVATIVAVFAVPSAFAFDSISVKEVMSIADYLRELGIKNKESIDAFQDSLTSVADRTLGRVRKLQWLVGTVWAVCSLGFAQSNTIIMKLTGDQKISEALTRNYWEFAIMLVVLVFLLAIIECYKKGHDAVFYRLQFAVRELKHLNATREQGDQA